MISANISLFKLKNPNFRNFLFKYTGQSIPAKSRLRKNVCDCYSNKINYIKIYNKFLC